MTDSSTGCDECGRPERAPHRVSCSVAIEAAKTYPPVRTLPDGVVVAGDDEAPEYSYEIDIERDLALCDAATEGPWRTERSKYVAGRYVIGDRENITLVEAAGGTVTRPEDAEFAAAARLGWPAALRELEQLRAEMDIVRKHINQRPEYINALKNCSGNNDHDYYRWSGGAEGRRQLAQGLGWTVPHEFGDRTAPKPKET